MSWAVSCVLLAVCVRVPGPRPAGSPPLACGTTARKLAVHVPFQQASLYHGQVLTFLIHGKTHRTVAPAGRGQELMQPLAVAALARIKLHVGPAKCGQNSHSMLLAKVRTARDRAVRYRVGQWAGSWAGSTP